MGNNEQAMNRRKTDEKPLSTIPYFVHEAELFRMERVQKRLVIMNVITGLLVPAAFFLGTMAK